MLDSIRKAAEGIIQQTLNYVGATSSKPKITVQPTPKYTGKLAVGSSSTLKTSGFSGLQKTQTGLQQTATGGLQTTAKVNPQQAPPPKTKRTFKQVVLDQNTQQFKTIDKVQSLTDEEWKHAQAVNQKMVNIQKEINNLRSNYKDEFTYKNELYDRFNSNVKASLAQVEQSKKFYEDKFKQLNNELTKAFQAKDPELYDKIYNQLVQLDTEADNYFRNAQQQFEAYEKVVQSELDRSDLFKDANTRGIWNKFKKFGAGLYNYTLGEKGILDPKRFVNFGINLVNPDRTRFTHGGDFEGEGKIHDQQYGSNPIQRAWNASQMQRYRKQTATADLDTLDRGTINFLDFATENFLDPSILMGGKGATKFKEVVRGTSTFKKTSKAISSARTAFMSTKMGKAVDWLGDTHKTFKGRRSDILRPLFRKQSKNVARSKQAAKYWKSYKKQIQRRFDDYFRALDGDEVTNLQKLFTAQGDWSKVKNVSKSFTQAQRNKLTKMYTHLKNFTDDLYQQEKLLDPTLRYRRGYYPIQRQSMVKKFSKDPIAGTKSFFRKARRSNDALVLDKDDLAFSYAQRTLKSRWDTRNNPILKRLDEATQSFDETSKLIDRTKRTIKPNLWEKATTPMDKVGSLWRQSVLAYRPAWRVNNELYNQLAGITAGGGKFLKNQKGWRKYVKELGQELTDEQLDDIVGGFAEFIGKKKAAKGFVDRTNIKDRIAGGVVDQETRARVALYKALRDRGMDHEKAIKDLNAWLFDYTVKNWQRPLRTAAPFYKFQAGVMRTAATMPLRTPRGAQVWRGALRELYDTPIKRLPDESYTTTDPTTGERITVNPRKDFEGRLNIPGTDTFLNTPFQPFSRQQFGDISKNPILTAFDELATNRDRWGNKLNGQQWWESFAKSFPQFTIAKNYINRDKEYVKNWLARNSALPKEKVTKESDRFAKSLQSYLGKPSHRTFNAKEFDEKKRFIEFNNAFWSTDWDKKYEDFNERRAAQEQLAKDYKFDLQKDIYDGYWSKYDTDFTSTVKKDKQQAFEFESGFWDEYQEQAYGTKGEFVRNKVNEWAKIEKMLENPEYRILKKWFSDLIQDKKFNNIKSKPAQNDALAIAASILGQISNNQDTDKGQFWQQFFALKDNQERLQFYAENWKPEFGGKGIQDLEKTLFWLQWYNSNPDIRKKMLAEHPEYRRFEFEYKTPEEWDKVRAERFAANQAKFAGNKEFQETKTAFRDRLAKQSTRKRAKSQRTVWKFT